MSNEQELWESIVENNQQWAEKFVPSARNTDPETSKANADAFVKKLSQREALLLTYYNAYMYDNYVQLWGLTDEQAGMATVWNGSTMYALRICYWKRCSELRKLGFIEPTGRTRISSANQQQQVCRITVEGMKHVEQLLYG